MAKKVGRTAKLNIELIENIGKLLSGGNYVNTIVDYLGISSAIYYKWIADAAEVEKKITTDETYELTDYEELLLELLDSIKKNSKQAEIDCVVGILKAGDTQWQAKAWYLERRNHKNWGRKLDVAQTIKKEELTEEEKSDQLAEWLLLIKDELDEDKPEEDKS